MCAGCYGQSTGRRDGNRWVFTMLELTGNKVKNADATWCYYVVQCTKSAVTALLCGAEGRRGQLTHIGEAAVAEPLWPVFAAKRNSGLTHHEQITVPRRSALAAPKIIWFL